VIGERSFGKGVMQEIIPLSTVSNAAIRLTIASYFSPLGSKIDQVGIRPDMVMPFSLSACQGKCQREMNNDHSPMLLSKNDDYIATAISILHNPEQYNKLLNLPSGVGQPEDLLSSVEHTQTKK
jgi:hypothetical protein